MKPRNQFVFILGPHRSGSSLLAAGLHSSGVNLGNQFIEPNEDNPKGFFEDEEIVRFNDRLLRSMNLSWDSFGFIWQQDFASEKLRPYYKFAVAMVSQRFTNVRVAGLKDPRFCILLPFWKRVIEEALDADANYVLSIREPEQCVRSQKARHIKDSDFHLLGWRNTHTLLLWLTYLSKALVEVDPARLIIVNYTSLVEAPELELRRLARFIGRDLSQQEIEYFCRNQVDPLLNRSHRQGAINRTQQPLLWEIADTLYERLLALSKSDSIERDEFTGVTENLDIQQLAPICIRELQSMYGYSYKKIISLRHRLIKTISETNAEREKLENMASNYQTLQDQHQSLAADYQLLSLDHQTVLNTRGWKLLTAIRRYLPWRLG